MPKPPGIRPLSPAKPEPTIDVPTTAQIRSPDAQTSDTEHPAPDADAREGAAGTRVAEAGARAIVETAPAAQRLE